MVHLVVLVLVGSVGARKVGISFKSLLSIGKPSVGNMRVRISHIGSVSVGISSVGSLGVGISKSTIQGSVGTKMVAVELGICLGFGFGLSGNTFLIN
jgi:hypothetical protein